MSRETIKENSDPLEADEVGLTVSFEGDMPKEGYVYSENERAEVNMQETGDLSEMVAIFINNHHQELNKAGKYVGIWKEKGRYYIDIVRVAKTKEEAFGRANEHHQKAIYDLVDRKVIYVK